MLHTTCSAICAAVLLALIPSAADARPIARKGLAPEAFATIALPVDHTSFDARWSRVLNSGIGPNAISERASHLRGMERLQSVNTSANQAIMYREDGASGKTSDYWANAGQTLARGSGDCEDYAIAKMQLLLNAGVPAGDIFLVIGDDLRLGSAHAMLLVRQAGRVWVLDSLSDQIRLSASYSDFRPIISFGLTGAWLHGYASGAAPRNMLARRASAPRLAAYNNLTAVVAAQNQ